MATVGDNLRILRIDRGFTQEDVANKVGCTRFSVANYELGRRNPSVKMLTNFAKALGVTVDTITNTSHFSNTLSLTELSSLVFSDEAISQTKKDETFMRIMQCYMLNKKSEGGA